MLENRTAVEYVPSPHTGHWEASLRARPVENVPAGQAAQELETSPEAVLYAPAPHEVHWEDNCKAVPVE